MKRTLLLLIFLVGIISLHGDEPAAATAPITDPVLVGEHYREVLGRPQFQETDESAVDTRLQDWLSQWFKRLGKKFGEVTYTSRMPAFESLLMTLLVVFSISVLLYIMVRLTRRRGGMEPEPTNGSPGPKAFRPPEFYDEEIHQAIRARDWHTAWLAAWRQFLSRLERRHLVEADRTRTNREYLAQLRGKPLPGSALALLTGLVDAYDRVIYGRQSISEPEWNLFHRQIDEAGLLLHLEDKGTNAQATRNAS
jgi:preprotein translocase subunit SecE